VTASVASPAATAVDLDDARGFALATLHALGMAATFVGVPVAIARRMTGGRRALVAPVALTVAAGLTIATQRAGWRLVKLWLGIDGRPDYADRRAISRSITRSAGSPRRSSRPRGG
jgi:hypothetical protein